MPGSENKELIKIILDRLYWQGKISFAEFMEMVLYHPQQGYYHSPREKIGAGGDYYTSPNLHPIFGRLIARQLYQMWEALDHPYPFTIVEMGAGKGLLCADILSCGRKNWPGFYKAVVYHLAEVSKAFIAEQKSLLAEFAAEGKIEWISPDLFLQGQKPFTGCLLSNELIDSFPVHLVCQQRGEIREVFVTHDGKSFLEILDEPSTPLLREYFPAYGSPLQDGQRAEVNLNALQWLEGVSRALKQGFVLTIDYGFEAQELYHPSRRDGTLLCYFRHTVAADPFQRLGYQDITAHVNFSALIRKGETVGLRKIGFTEQFKFLAALGLLQDLEELEKNASQLSPVDFLKNKLAMKNFLVPGGMGTLFKVLVQSKGLGDIKLKGFADPLSSGRERISS